MRFPTHPRFRHNRHPSKASVVPIYERISKYRDQIAIMAGFSYALGYASRALHAWDFNFGALPGVRFDYIVAGVLLLLPSAGLVLCLWLLYVSGINLIAWSATHSKKSNLVQRRVIGPIMTICGLVYLSSKVLPQSLINEKFQILMAGIVLVSMIFGTILAAGTSAVGSTKSKEVLTFAPNLLVIIWGFVIKVYLFTLLLITFLMAAFSGAYILRYVPQEFGGVKPKSAILDLATDQVSPELVTLLSNQSLSEASTSKIVRTKMLEVFSTSGPWLIRVPGQPTSTSTRSFRIPEQAVKTVEWVSNAAHLPRNNFRPP